MAAGSQDKSVSVWVQGESKPLFVLRRAFRDSISDLAWSREGTCLLAVSLDGTALTVSFTEDEIGRPLTEDKARRPLSPPSPAPPPCAIGGFVVCILVLSFQGLNRAGLILATDPIASPGHPPRGLFT